MSEPGPPLNARLKTAEYEDGKISRLVFVDEHGERFCLEGEMRIVDPYDGGESSEARRSSGERSSPGGGDST